MKLDPGLPGIRGATNHSTTCNVTSHKLPHLLFTALLHDMQHFPSRESVNRPVNKFPEFYGTSKLHYRVYNSPKLVTILCHMNPAHAVPFRSLKTNHNATLQSASRTPQVVYLLRVSQPKPWRPRHFCSIPSHACHILRPSDLNRTLLFIIDSLRSTHSFSNQELWHDPTDTKHTSFLQYRGLTLEETSFTRSECPCITRGCICQLPTYFISSSLLLLVRCLDLVSSHATQADCTRSEHLFSKVRLIKTNTLQLTWLPATKP